MQGWENLLVGCDVDLRVLMDPILTNDIVVHSPKSAQFETYLLDFEGFVKEIKKTLNH